MGVRNPADFISRHTGSTQAVQYSRQRKILEKRTLICVTQTKMKEISPTITASQNAEPPRGTETAHSVFCVQLDETPAWSSKLRICWLTAWYNCGLRSPAPPLSPWANFIIVMVPISRGYLTGQNEVWCDMLSRVWYTVSAQKMSVTGICDCGTSGQSPF